MFESTNGGASWTAVNTGLTNSFVVALAINPTTPSTIYAGTDGGGVFQSTNGGTSWTAINTGLTNLSVHTFAINTVTPSTVYAGTNGDSVFVLSAVCGDVNGDGVVNIGDALIVAQYDVGLRTCGQAPFSHPEVCDVNRDGSCNIGDALLMAQCDVGLISCAFTCKGPAVFPATGSPNPMLTGIALGRRMGDRLATQTTPVVAPGFTSLFDGKSFKGWRMSTVRNQPGHDNPGHFIIVDGALEAVTGTDLGLLWNTTPLPPDFTLRLQWRRWSDFDNSGVFVRFPDPESKGYNNTAFVGVDFGFEVQIDEPGAPDGAPLHKTGAIYGQPSQTFTLQPARPVGVWNDYEIRVQGNTYLVFLNGAQVTDFINGDANRGRPSTPAAPSYMGLQLHTGRVQFRNIQVR